MYAIDFEYDGRCLSDYGFMVCDFDVATGVNTIDAGSQITFNTVSMYNGKRNNLTGTQYDSCIECSFDICKNPDLYSSEEMEFSDYEYREIVRWLNRKEFLKFCFVDDDHQKDVCYYDANFNIEEIKIGEKLYGARLTMKTNRPFGYGEDQSQIFEIVDCSQTYNLTDISDEIGYTYPDMVITCSTDGDLTVANITENISMVIANCTAGEVITIYGNEQIIETSSSAHAIYDDFNFEFFRIANTLENRKNEFSVSIPCKLEIRYSPVVKGTF